MADKKQKKKANDKSNSKDKDKSCATWMWTDPDGRTYKHVGQPPPEVTTIYLLSETLRRIAKYVANRESVTVERTLERKFTDKELLDDLEGALVICNNATELGRQLVGKWSQKVRATLEDCLVVVGKVRDPLKDAFWAIEDLEEEKKKPGKKRTKEWTDKFNKSPGFQREFSEDGLKGYIEFKKKSLVELPARHSVRAYEWASRYYDELQDLSKRLTVRFAEHWKKPVQEESPGRDAAAIQDEGEGITPLGAKKGTIIEFMKQHCDCGDSHNELYYLSRKRSLLAKARAGTLTKDLPKALGEPKSGQPHIYNFEELKVNWESHCKDIPRLPSLKLPG